MDGLTEGRMCHYVAYNNRHLAAIIIGTSSINRAEQSTENPNNFTIYSNVTAADLAVFTNMENTAGQKNFGLQFHQGVLYSETKEPGTWHWIERA